MDNIVEQLTINVEVCRLEHFDGFVGMGVPGDEIFFWATPEDAWEAVADTVRTKLIDIAREARERA